MSDLIKISSRLTLKDFLSEIWEHRNLILVFAWRDLRVRYAQTALGLLWAMVQPLFTIFVLWLVFGRFLKVDTGGVPALSFVASGVALWSYFSFVAQQSAQSIIQSQAMIKKIYFPKIILPISKALLGLVDLVVVVLILLAVLFFNGAEVSKGIFIMPLILLSLLLFSLGIGIWISALSIEYRDLQHIFPFIIQLGIYITPVAYPSSFAQSMLPDWATWLYYLNPVAGLIDLLRYSIFDNVALSEYWFYSLVSGFLIFGTGVVYFKYTQKKIADLI